MSCSIMFCTILGKSPSAYDFELFDFQMTAMFHVRTTNQREFWFADGEHLMKEATGLQLADFVPRFFVRAELENSAVVGADQ